MPREYCNKLTIYLIKDEYTNDVDIFKNVDDLSTEQIDEVGNIYYGESYIFSPTWLKKFFGSDFDNYIKLNGNNKLKIFSASAKAVLLVQVEGRLFAVTFGYGRTLLNPGVWEERFGLKVLVNIIDHENIRNIDRKNMTVIPKLVTEQMTRSGSVADFGIDIEQDLLQGMTGKSKFEEFGQTVTGKDALSLSIKIKLKNIKNFLKLCYEKYNSSDYKNNFSWIDNIAEIKSPKIIEELNNELIEKVKNSGIEDIEKIWMAIPSIIPWEKVLEFRMESNKNSLGDDIYLQDFIMALDPNARDNLSLGIFKSEIIDCIGAENEELIDHWKAYNCLYGELTKNDKTYILSNGRWYEVETNFANEINNHFEGIRTITPVVSLPESQKGEKEDEYNKRVSVELSGVCNMDSKLVSHGGAHSKIEFCDLLTSDKKIIHVKRYGASSVLSHLFSQGLVSGELFLSDVEFRKKVRDILPSSHRSLVPITRPESSEYTIVFAIVSKHGNLIDIPFFSKINLRNAQKRLNGAFRYNVSFMTMGTESES